MFTEVGAGLEGAPCAVATCLPHALCAEPCVKLIWAVFGSRSRSRGSNCIVVVGVVVVFVVSDTLVHILCAHRLSKQPVHKPCVHATVAYMRSHSFMPPLVWLALRWVAAGVSFWHKIFCR